jgi:GT2 family glycosyltransferase
MSSATVVVPVRGRTPGLAACLSATCVAAATDGAAVVVVDDGADRDVLDGLRERHPEVEVLRSARPGAYAARNTGVRHVLDRGEVAVLFTDGDCRPRPGWVRHLLGLLGSADAVQGGSRIAGARRLAVSADEDYQRRLAAWAGEPLTCGGRAGTLDTRNCAVRVEAFTDLGLFDERVRYAGDALWGRRALAAGRTIAACGHVLVLHEPPVSWRSVWDKHAGIAEALCSDLRCLPRRDVVRFLPEHAHLLVRMSSPARETARHLVRPEAGRAAYVRLREAGWLYGRWRWQRRHPAAGTRSLP